MLVLQMKSCAWVVQSQERTNTHGPRPATQHVMNIEHRRKMAAPQTPQSTDK